MTIKQYYSTSEVAALTGIHPNTVRLYEKLELLPPVERLPNGYRSFTELHITHIKMARTAFQVEVLQNGLRKQAVTIIKTAAAGDYNQALALTSQYLSQIDREKCQAEEALGIVKDILLNLPEGSEQGLEKSLGQSFGQSFRQSQNYEDRSTSQKNLYTRKEAADELHITIDTLRNWELNGLFTAKRKQNGYRVYTEGDLQTLKIIRSLRCANYSLASILRMLNTLSWDPHADIRLAIDTSEEEDDIITVCDHLLTSLEHAGNNALLIQSMLNKLVF